MTTLQELQDRIVHAVDAQDFAEAARLAKIAQDIKSLLSSAASRPVAPPKTECEAVIEKPIPVPGSISRKGANRGKFVIEVTLDGEHIRLQESTAPDTMVRFMERILAHLGIGALEKLATLSVNRGPMLSRQPQLHYVNSRTKEIYMNHRIAGTDFYMLTQTANAEKIRDVKAACRLLGIPSSAVKVYVE